MGAGREALFRSTKGAYRELCFHFFREKSLKMERGRVGGHGT